MRDLCLRTFPDVCALTRERRLELRNCLVVLMRA
jgi:hypothetical protein